MKTAPTSQATQPSSTSLTCLHGEQTASAPDGYVKSQKNYNTLHTNGASTKFVERAIHVASVGANLAKHWQLPIGSILDVGCRTGYVMDKFEELFPCARVVGVDVVPDFVALAQEVGEAHVGDMHDLPFKDDEFDWIFCSQTLEHCYDVRKAMQELYRVAKIGLMLSVPLEQQKSYEGNPSHYAYSSSSFVWLDYIHNTDWDVAQSWIRGPEFNLIVIHKDGVAARHEANDG